MTELSALAMGCTRSLVTTVAAGSVSAADRRDLAHATILPTRPAGA